MDRVKAFEFCKVYERNPDTNVIRWRYVLETKATYGWPHYGNILTESHLPSGSTSPCGTEATNGAS